MGKQEKKEHLSHNFTELFLNRENHIAPIFYCKRYYSEVIQNEAKKKKKKKQILIRVASSMQSFAISQCFVSHVAKLPSLIHRLLFFFCSWLFPLPILSYRHEKQKHTAVDRVTFKHKHTTHRLRTNTSCFLKSGILFPYKPSFSLFFSIIAVVTDKVTQYSITKREANKLTHDIFF